MATQPDSAHVLVVDDDEGLLILMAESLRGEGYGVTTAGSGREALERLGGQVPDLMLLDLKMQDMDGTALLRTLRERGVPVPFVVVTGRGDEKVAVETMKEGALDYVMKDTGLLDLLPAVVRRALGSVGRDRELAAAQAERLRLEGEIVATSEKERHNIGADLHDGLGQQLTAIELICTSLRDEVAALGPELSGRLEQVVRLLREAITQTRMLARGLVPINDDPDALTMALGELAARMSSEGHVRCRLDCEETLAVSDPVVAGHLYRIAQEAVNNAVKHGGASEILIRLARRAGQPWLRISDNGKGLPKGGRGGPGVGLRVMSHRARVIGAELTVSTKRDAGVSVTCAFPEKK
jgi:signal transduction histidine kinase